MESVLKFKAAIIGGTGGVGKKLIQLLVTDDRCDGIIAVVRKPLEDWDTEEHKAKLRIIELENMDNLSERTEDFEGYDYFFSCLGARGNAGKELYTKVDKTYPVEFAKIARDNEAERFTIVSAIGANHKSWISQTRTKGECEEDLKGLGLKNLTITRPGLLEKRDADWRLAEKLTGLIPFFPKID